MGEIDIILSCPDDHGYYCMAYCDDVSDYTSDLCVACWADSMSMEKEKDK